MIRDSGILVFLFAACLLIFCAAAATAQITTAEIVGAVTDASGGVMPGATVTIKNLSTGITRSMPTNEVGNYAFSLLTTGSYSLTVEASGFKTFTATNVTLAAGDHARVNARMEVGGINETVEVNAQSAGALQTDTATVGSLVTDKAVQDLPVNGRNFIMLVRLAPGVNDGGNAAGGTSRPDDRRMTSGLSANGGPWGNNFLLDGMDNNERSISTIIIRPSIDAMQEVKIQTSNYSADIGRAGGAVVNMITKSGTNSFHGSLFEFLRNDLFDAKDFFNVPQAGNPAAGVKPKFRQNQYGFSLGGPIIKNRTFFFADYEGLRIIQGQTRSVTVPTACELGKAACNGVTQIGNFSDVLPKVIKDPFTGQPYPNNIIPASKINLIAANYAALYPALPASACLGIVCNFISSPNNTQTAHAADLRIDHRFGDKDSLFGRFSINNTQSFVPDYLPVASVAGLTVHPNGSNFNAGFPSYSDQAQQSWNINHIHVFRPNLLLQLGFQLARFVSDTESLNAGTNVNDAFGGPLNANSSVRGTDGLLFLWFLSDGYAGIGDAFAIPTAYWDTNYQYNGNVIWSKGSHGLNLGMNVLRRDWSQFQTLFKGAYQFSGTAAGGGLGTTGNSFASLLAGYPSNFQRNISLVAPQYRATEFGWYVQDNWRATNWLTLNLGVRYDIFTPLKEKHNNISNFDPTIESVRKGGVVQVAGQNGVSETVNIATQYGDIQPRLGFAATVFKGMVIRGGFGMSYYPSNSASPATLKNQPFSSSGAFPNSGFGGASVYTLSTPLPPIVPDSTCLVAACGRTTTTTVPFGSVQDYKYTRIKMYNLTVEKEFAGNVLSVGYVGMKGSHLPRVYSNANLPLPPKGPGGCGLDVVVVPGPCQPYYADLPLVTLIQLLRTDGSMDYNSMQVVFQRRYKNGLTMSSNYTLAHTLSNAAASGGQCAGCGINGTNLKYDWGNGDTDRRHRLAFSANYALPFGKLGGWFSRQVIGGWEMNGILALATGVPFTVTDSLVLQNTPGMGSGSTSGDRPDAVAQGSFPRSLTQWFDTSAFRQQVKGTAGNEGRNQYYGPGQKRVDVSIFKTFKIRESVKLQFRCEAFNITNTPNFAQPGSTISSWTSSDPATARPTSAGNFGRITATSGNYTPRDIQFALKLLF